jgi:Arc/MetJ-type ribon-helix-helix transcriptional regulator
MTRLRPACDRHTNLQMIPCSLKRTPGQAHAYVCPVPGCGRHCDDLGYFDVETRGSLEGGIRRNRCDAVKAAIMKALEERARPSILPSKQQVALPKRSDNDVQPTVERADVFLTMPEPEIEENTPA